MNSNKLHPEPSLVTATDQNIDRYLCGDLDIRIDRDGNWFYHGSPIGRKELVRLFASVLQRDEEGRYWLITPAEKGEIVVEDAAFMGVEMFADGAGKDQILSFRTNVDDKVIADAAHPLRIETDPETGEPSPYILVRGRLEARLNRPVFYELVEIGNEEVIEGEAVYGVWSSGKFFEIGKLEQT
jgi:hypothetical protein